MSNLTFQEAVVAGIAEEMDRDLRVFHLGQDIGPVYNGAMHSAKGLGERFGPARIIETPISEGAMMGAGIGAAIGGMRPIVQIMFAEFLGLTVTPLACDAAAMWYKSDGQTCVPLVVRVLFGAGPHRGHSEDYQAWVASTPGIKVVMPSCPRDAKGLMKAAIRDNNPVVFFEHMGIYHGSRQEVPDEDHVIPLGKADIKRQGTDVTLVATALMVQQALKAAEQLQQQGISVEVIDPRTIVPMDVDTVLSAVARTRRLVVISETWKTGDPLSDLAATVAEELGGDAPLRIARAGLQNTPRPFAMPLTRAAMPGVQTIVETVRRVMEPK
ncbi:pyruvate dehydrogenase E1 component beta subunit [Mycoplana sp. BE70]|uniref:alpha-ketoacid dehydrogenase subunit beta n=1 Tax=Mycoplana sp. BE70 TaxID=2817775 RepID=UPI002863C888|nr:transketolase C-terminal domain-containing protein [Mycoplana sp. BE70]MDR6758783.1 pyruvate dehydrogenase E1 component beta subunit [Mycoplana sp. BE70]